MRVTYQLLCCLLVLGAVTLSGCGKDPKKNPDFNPSALDNPGSIKMGGDARPENAKPN
ncbi:MAG: hypothetical protein ACK553_03035 [Planctomycetota bacterium]|jgi:hypothetical protein